MSDTDDLLRRLRDSHRDLAFRLADMGRENERMRSLLAKTEPALMNCPVRDEVREYLKRAKKELGRTCVDEIKWRW